MHIVLMGLGVNVTVRVAQAIVMTAIPTPPEMSRPPAAAEREVLLVTVSHNYDCAAAHVNLLSTLICPLLTRYQGLVPASQLDGWEGAGSAGA